MGNQIWAEAEVEKILAKVENTHEENILTESCKHNKQIVINHSYCISLSCQKPCCRSNIYKAIVINTVLDLPNQMAHPTQIRLLN